MDAKKFGKFLKQGKLIGEVVYNLHMSLGFLILINTTYWLFHQDKLPLGVIEKALTYDMNPFVLMNLGNMFFLGFWLILGKVFLPKALPLYRICPNCNNSIKIYVKWRCDYCKNPQKSEIFIMAACGHCGRYLEKVYCEHCDQKLDL